MYTQPIRPNATDDHAACTAAVRPLIQFYRARALKVPLHPRMDPADAVTATEAELAYQMVIGTLGTLLNEQVDADSELLANIFLQVGQAIGSLLGQQESTLAVVCEVAMARGLGIGVAAAHQAYGVPGHHA